MSNPTKTVGNTSVLLLALENTGRLWGYKIARVIPVIFAGQTLEVYANCRKTYLASGQMLAFKLLLSTWYP